MVIYVAIIVFETAVAASLCTSTEDDSDMAAYIRGLSPSASEVSEEVPKTLTGKPKVGYHCDIASMYVDER